MSLGNWYYYKKKFKLITLKYALRKSNKKNLLALTYEDGWGVQKPWHITYHSTRCGFKIIGKPDLVIEREFNDGNTDYSILYQTILKKVPKAFWFIDAHTADINRVKYCDQFDFVFVAQSPFINYVKKNTSCKNIFWLPLCFPKPANQITAHNTAIKHPVSFIGLYGKGYNRRVEMINFLANEYKEKFFAVTDYNNPKLLAQASAVTTNCSLNNDLNFRVFECLGYGTELVTDHVTDVDKIEGLTEQLYCYRDFNGLKKHIDELLAETPGKKHNISKVQQWVLDYHTLEQRIAQMLQMIDTGKQVEYK